MKDGWCWVHVCCYRSYPQMYSNIGKQKKSTINAINSPLITISIKLLCQVCNPPFRIIYTPIKLHLKIKGIKKNLQPLYSQKKCNAISTPPPHSPISWTTTYILALIKRAIVMMLVFPPEEEMRPTMLRPKQNNAVPGKASSEKESGLD